MIKELILTTMFSFSPLINGVSPSKADVFFSSSDSETSEEVVTLDDGKKYYKVYDYETNDVSSSDGLIVGNVYRLNFYLPDDSLYYHSYFVNNSLSCYVYFYDFIINISNLGVNATERVALSSYVGDYIYYNNSLNRIIFSFSTFNNTDYAYIVSYYISPDVILTSNNFYCYVVLSPEKFNLTTEQFNAFISSENTYKFFSNAGDNIPYHLEEVGHSTTLFDIINDWYLSLFSNDTLDSYKFNLFGKEVSMTQYLCNVATIITLVSLVIAVVSITLFIFKLSAGLFKW